MRQRSTSKAQDASLTDQTIQEILDLLQRETDLTLSAHLVARCVHEAESAARNSYAPYIKPNFGSGVTILGSDGGTASGSRVENACTNLTLSASSVAAWRSIFLGLKSPQLIVQWRSGEGYQGMEPTIFQGLSGDLLSGFAPNAVGIEIDPGVSVQLVKCPRSSHGLPTWNTPEFSAQDAPSAERIFGKIRQESHGQLEEKEVIRLREAALDAARHAYAPFSRYPVGAALLTYDGQIYAGSNIEFWYPGSSICAERNAIGGMVTLGALKHSKFGDALIKAVAVFVPNDGDPATPCGACRQVLFEFGPRATCFSFNLGRTIKVRDMNELLPRAFGPSTMISLPPRNSACL